MENLVLIASTIFDNVFKLLSQNLVPGFEFSFLQLFLGIAALNIIFIFLKNMLHIGSDNNSVRVAQLIKERQSK